MDEAAIEAHVAALIEGSRRHAPGNRRAIAGIATTRQLPLASHDDASRAHVEEAAALGAVLTEFPTTLAAAQAAGELGIAVLMGAPNLIRGGSHAGNVAAATLAEAGHLDILSSDYIPSALLQAAFRLSEGELGQSLPEAVAKVTAAPAAAVGLGDRGVVAPGYRADLIRVQLVEGRALVRAVWVEGERVA
jgi:alpha-D-ribose 1-methylphosphonate 5-triphosphate diphosphatase